MYTYRYTYIYTYIYIYIYIYIYTCIYVHCLHENYKYAYTEVILSCNTVCSCP